jgi:hypothetical protein
MSFNIILSFNLGLPSYLFIHISGNRLHLVMPTNYEALLHSVFTNIMSLPPSVGKNIPLITLFNTASVCLCVSYSSYLWHATPYVLITH